MNKIILSITFIFVYCVTALAQYDSIPQSQIPIKIQEIKEGTLKDSIFWSCVGLFDALEYSFASLYDYKIYVSNQGVYFALSFKDKLGNISISGVYFMPHIRKPIPEVPPSDFVWVPNEHFCQCTAVVGYSIIQKTKNSFTCIGAIPEYDTDDNVNISCHDTEARQIFFKKHYKKGLEYVSKLKLIEPEVLLYSVDDK